MTTDNQEISSGLHHEDLYERLGWLIRLRWLASVGLLATVLIARYALDLRPAMIPLLALNGLLVVANALYWFLWEGWRDASNARLVKFGVVQTVLDYLVLTMVLHYSGGIENPLVITFVFQCTIASMLFSARLSYLLALLAVALVGGMVVLEQTNVWPHWHLIGYLPPEISSTGLFLAGVFITLAVVLFVSVYLTTTIELASRKRRAESARRSMELEEAREQIRQADKMAALGQLAASIAHDINNPVGVLCARLEVMEAEGAFKDLPERLSRDLNTVRECAQYLRRVTENWTRFMRKAAPQMERVDLNEAVRRTAAIVTDSLVTHGIRVQLDLYPSPLRVRGDLVRLQQTVLNLVSNARDAMMQGGTLTVRTRVSHATNPNSGAVLEVADTGIGIAPEDLEHIFEPFFSRKPVGRGTGLGLAICQKFVKEMDGEIHVRSEVGVGTVFSINLPIYAPSKRVETYAHT